MPTVKSDIRTSLTAREASAAAAAAASGSTPFSHGSGAINPVSVNNKGIMALFALLGAGLVVMSIWFFFWARNGGFVWQQGDWDDYKSSVLRRKGKDGKTLSNATKRSIPTDSSAVSSNSIVGDDYDREEKGFVPPRRGGGRAPAGPATSAQKKKQRDADMAEYRHEKPARVGGLNRKADGSYSNGAAGAGQGSAGTFDPPRRTKHKNKHKTGRPARFQRDDDVESSVPTEDDSGTKSYHHPMPGRRTDTRAPRQERGYRRGGGGRRDSLSESE